MAGSCPPFFYLILVVDIATLICFEFILHRRNWSDADYSIEAINDATHVRA